MAPRFLITIDTEGDNLWSRPKQITTRNAKFLSRFQALCESYGLKPTYLTNYEMAECMDFREFGRDVIKRSAGEIGMHLHAWNSPPVFPLTPDDYVFQPYLIEYPEGIMRQKITHITDLLEREFDVKMRSHRAGRWCLNEVYARILVEHGYQVDCSVTPHVSWKTTRGAPSGSGGVDYSGFPDRVYWIDLQNIRRPGDSPLLEVPVTIVDTPNLLIKGLRSRLGEDTLPRRAFNQLFHFPMWLRPNGKNLKHLTRIIKLAQKEQRDYVQCMLHSSELMPGGSPRFPKDHDIERLYEDLNALFSVAKTIFDGATMTEYYRAYSNGHAAHEMRLADTLS